MSALGNFGFRSLGRKSRRGLASILNLLRFRPSGRNAVRGAALRALAVLALLLGWGSAHAGFQSLPTAANPGDPVARVTGFNNESIDLILGLKLPDGSANCPCPPPAGFVELDSRSHSVFVEGFNVGTLFDFVFRDTSDNNLVLGARLVLNPVVNGAPNAFEVNDFLRRNNSGFSNAWAGWSRAEDPDLRMFAAARTAVRFGEGTETFSLDTIKFQTDVNVSEGNPQSGYFFLKTDAPYYTTMANSLSIYQGGEEGQDLLELFFSGFVASNVNPDDPGTETFVGEAPLPLPAALPMMLGALGILSVSKRVRRRTNA